MDNLRQSTSKASNDRATTANAWPGETCRARLNSEIELMLRPGSQLCRNGRMLLSGGALPLLGDSEVARYES